MNLDEKLTKLKDITDKLENSNVSLDEGIVLFEEGGKIAKECFEALNQVKGKIMQIKKDFVGEEEMK